MKIQELESLERELATYRVHMELRENGMLASDMCPDRYEPALQSLDQAKLLAARIAKSVPRAVNIYPIYADSFSPVENYRTLMLRKYPHD